MRSKLQIVLPVLAVGLLLLVGVATESLGQSRRSATRDPILRGNPRRDAGGSCVYNKDGKVVFAPAGKNCPDATDHLSLPRTALPPVVASYPPAMRGELSKLLADHGHIDREIVRLQQAVGSQNRNAALESATKVREYFTDHRAREERFLEMMAPKRVSR